MGHTFAPQHGFTGSAGKSLTPQIPGFAHGGMDEVEHGEHHHGDHPKHDHAHHDKDGYQHHKGHGHKAMHRIHGMHKKGGGFVNMGGKED